MQNQEEILYTGEYKYLSKILEDLPDNSMFNKVLTGCGGTTVALENGRSYVICVPFKSLANNKAKWAKKHNIELLVVHGDSIVTDSDIMNFKGKKIIVTYDSLPRVINLINPIEWKLLVDESHKLVDSGNFRDVAINGILNNYHKFGSFVFMTATPVKDKYQLPQLVGIPKSTIKWTNIKPVNIKFTKVTDDIGKHTALLSLDYLEGRKEGNAHIFINSVSSIIKVLDYLIQLKVLNYDLVKIVCADNVYNKNRIKSKLGSKYAIDTTTTDAKKINFYTSTAFEGHDIHDTEAVVYVVTDGTIDTTKINILTTLPQIVNRIRDAKIDNEVNLLFTTSNYFSHATEEEFEQSVKQQLQEHKDIVKAFDTHNDTVKKALIKGTDTNKYISYYEGKLYVNETVWYNEMHSYSTIHTTYYVKDDSKIKDSVKVINEVTYNYNYLPHKRLEGYDKLRLGTKVDFKTICLEYLEVAFDNFINGNTKAQDIENLYPIIGKAYNILGEEKMKALGYREKLFRESLLIEDLKKDNAYKIIRMLGYRVGRWVSAEQVKVDLQHTFNKLGIKQKVTATTLNSYYEIKSKTIWDADSKTSVRGIVIIVEKFGINNNN